MTTQALQTLDTAALQELDNAHYLHPFTDYRELHAEGARIQAHGDGIYIYDTDGKRIIDGLAGLCCVNIGYGRPELGRAAAKQMETLSFSHSFFKTSHVTAIQLAEQLVAMTPAGLNHVFYASSGSEANDTCLKLVHRYWNLVGRPEKQVVIALEHSYHGSTIAAGGLSGIPALHGSAPYMPLAGVQWIPSPYWYLNGSNETLEDFGRTAASWLEEKILEIGPENVAAFFGEAMQGAGGAIIPPSTYWPEIERICRKYDVLLVVDEVGSGFGRTGYWFACEAFGIVAPDLMTLAKGMTSSYFPMSAAMVGDRIAEVLIDKGDEFFHGFTNSGHPVGCAVALENIRILRDEGIIENVAKLAPYFANAIESLADHPLVGDVRARGFLAGIQLVADKKKRQFFDLEQRVGEHCSAEALSGGLALRAIGDTMALMPPLIITAAQIDEVIGIVRSALDATDRWLHDS
jgi:putrescine aminotransferase